MRLELSRLGKMNERIGKAFAEMDEQLDKLKLAQDEVDDMQSADPAGTQGERCNGGEVGENDDQAAETNQSEDKGPATDLGLPETGADGAQ